MNKLAITKEIFTLIDALNTGRAMSMPKAAQYAFELEVNLEHAMSGKRHWTPLINEAYDIGAAIQDWEDQKDREAFSAERFGKIQSAALSALHRYKTSEQWKRSFMFSVGMEIVEGNFEYAQDLLDFSLRRQQFGDMPSEVFRILGEHTGITEFDCAESPHLL